MHMFYDIYNTKKKTKNKKTKLAPSHLFKMVISNEYKINEKINSIFRKIFMCLILRMSVQFGEKNIFKYIQDTNSLVTTKSMLFQCLYFSMKAPTCQSIALFFRGVIYLAYFSGLVPCPKLLISPECV